MTKLLTIDLRSTAPQMLGSRGTPSLFVFFSLKNMCAKFDAFTRFVTIFPLTDRTTKRSIKITDRFTCTSASVIYCITSIVCKKIYIGETGRRLGDSFREHLQDVGRNDKDASKPVARHFNLPNHSSHT